MNDAQKYLLNSGCDDLILNDRKCTKVEDRLYASDMMMEFARSYHEKLSKLHQGAVSEPLPLLCTCFRFNGNDSFSGNCNVCGNRPRYRFRAWRRWACRRLKFSRMFLPTFAKPVLPAGAVGF